jgi:phosphoglycolate phosphatase-like HAD superfamily hydrolase
MSNNLSDIELIFWDWDGCLCDSRPLIYQANMHILRHYDPSKVLSYEDWLAVSFPSAEDFIRSRGVSAPSAEINVLFSEGITLAKQNGFVAPLYEGARELLTLLTRRGVLNYIVSKHLKDHLQMDVLDHGVAEFFQDIIGKPSTGDIDKAEVMGLIQAEHQFPQSLYVGDMVHDIYVARQANIPIAVISHGYETREALEKENP